MNTFRLHHILKRIAPLLMGLALLFLTQIVMAQVTASANGAVPGGALPNSATEDNVLQQLIPTGENDVAVRQVLGKIFGDAILCKVPGAPCDGMQLTDGGSLAATMFSVFNAGTAIALTILLVFIGLFGFTKTALDGEFLGRSWNTTFTALRMLTAFAFLLPMPNSYTVIQNLVFYDALWGSGIANKATVAVSEHYIQRLQKSMVEAEPNATTLDAEMRQVLRMGLCVDTLSRYEGSNLQYRELDFGGANSRTEIAYIEKGTYSPPDSAPCGRFVIHKFKSAVAQDIKSSTPGTWNAALYASPLTSSLRSRMNTIATDVSKKVRDTKTDLIKSALQPGSDVQKLANYIGSIYWLGVIQYDPKTNQPTGVPSDQRQASRFVNGEAEDVINRYATVLASKQSDLDTGVQDARKAVFTTVGTAGSEFFTEARNMLQSGGWMATAATYRTLLDFGDITFTKPSDNTFSLELPNLQDQLFFSEYGANSHGQHLIYLDELTSKLLSSDSSEMAIKTAKGQMKDGVETAYAAAPKEITTADIKKVVSSGMTPQKALEQLYGTSIINSARNWVVKGMALNPDVDPLFQIKAIGDAVTATAETIVMGEIVVRTGLAFADVTQTAASKNIVGRGVNFVTGAGDTAGKVVSGFQYVLEGVFTFFKAISMALMALGYLFSTWLPALPFIAFLMATLGWVFGVVMTLFAINIWAVLHATPARGDSFIGSEAQGYLLLVSLFFRPVIAVCALALSYIVAPPIIGLINMTLIPMMYATNVSTNMISVLFGTIFCLVLYFVVIKGAIVMIYTFPQTFPDEILRIINAGMGDLGQSKGDVAMNSGGLAAGALVATSGRVVDQSGEHFRGTLSRNKEARDELAKQADKDIGSSQSATAVDPNGSGGLGTSAGSSGTGGSSGSAAPAQGSRETGGTQAATPTTPKDEE